jgi:ribose transport system ATP-binding protein
VRIRIRDLCKSFATPVLKGVNLDLAEGSVLGLVGENGAGKSTLINILSGLLPKNSGTLELDGDAYSPNSMQDSIAAGLSLAAQELSLIENLSVGENILLKALPSKKSRLHHKDIRSKSRTLLELVGLPELDPRTPLSKLSLAQKQLVELAKALSSEARVLILDEPTAALTGPQAERLHEIIRERAQQGLSVIYVSHRLDDVLSVCDNVAVLRDGEIQLSCATEGLSRRDLIQAMSGKSLLEHENDQARTLGAERLRVDKLTTSDLPNPISLCCHRSEILGIAGLAGAGRSELLEAIYGLTKHTGGKVELTSDDGPSDCEIGRSEEGHSDVGHSDVGHSEGTNSCTHVIQSADQAVKLGMGLVAEDRKTQGIFASKSIAMNTTVAGLKRVANSWGKLLPKNEIRAVEHLIQHLRVKCDGPDQAINRLSGGNQQKLLIARWMHNKTQVLLLDEPTRGVDVGSKLAIHQQLRELRDQGASMIIVSSELGELTALCDNILVLSERKHVASFRRGEWSNDQILQAAFSEHTSARSA